MIQQLCNYINNNTNCKISLYSSNRAISFIYNNIKYKFSIRQTNQSLIIEFIGLASNNSTKPYRFMQTKKEFFSRNPTWQDNIYKYMIEIVNTCKKFY